MLGTYLLTPIAFPATSLPTWWLPLPNAWPGWR